MRYPAILCQGVLRQNKSVPFWRHIPACWGERERGPGWCRSGTCLARPDARWRLEVLASLLVSESNALDNAPGALLTLPLSSREPCSVKLPHTATFHSATFTCAGPCVESRSTRRCCRLKRWMPPGQRHGGGGGGVCILGQFNDLALSYSVLDSLTQPPSSACRWQN
jgi:hypothetical protein